MKAEAERAHTEPRVGAKLGNYRLERMLGRGRMGVVFLARDEALLRRTAVKVLAWKFSADHIAQTPEAYMLAEAQFAARISHPSVVQVYGVARHGIHCFIAMEYVDGTAADRWIAKHGPLSIERATEILLQCADGLHAVHGAGVVHRDLKPENLLLTPEGGAKLVDFGMARQLVQGRAADGMRAGTPLYTAPEIWNTDIATPATDIYALGATYYYLLTGNPPFQAADLPALIHAHLHTPPPDVRTARPDAPDSCHALIQRCLAKSADGRYGTAQEVAWEARGLLRELSARRTRRSGAILPIEAAEPGAGFFAFRTPPFGPIDPEAPVLEGEPFGDLHRRLATLGSDAIDGAPRAILLTGVRGTGRSTFARQRAAAHRRRGATAVFVDGGTDPGGGGLIAHVARELGVVAGRGEPAALVDRLTQQLAEVAPDRDEPPLVVLDGLDAPGAPLRDVALLVRAAVSTGAFVALVTGGPELGTRLAEAGLHRDDPRLREVVLPALSASETYDYVRRRLRDALAVPRGAAVTPDAALAIYDRSGGNLAAIDRLARAMIERAATAGERVMGSRDAWTGAPADDLAPILDVRRREIGLPPRGAGPAAACATALAELPGVGGVVVGHAGGAVLDTIGARDGERTAALHTCAIRGLDQVASQLGLGVLQQAALVGASSTYVIARRTWLVVGIDVDPARPLAPLESQLGALLDR